MSPDQFAENLIINAIEPDISKHSNEIVGRGAKHCNIVASSRIVGRNL